MSTTTSDTPGLDALLADPSQVRTVAGSQVPPLLCQVGAILTMLAARLAESDQSPAPAEDRLLTVDEAAARLACSRDWLWRRTRSLPFVVPLGRLVRYSSNGIDRFIRQREGRR